MRPYKMFVFVVGTLALIAPTLVVVGAEDEPKGYAGGAHKMSKEAPGERLTSEAVPNLDWVYVGCKGGHHLAKSGMGRLVTSSGGVFLSTTLKFKGEDSNYWVYEIEGYQEQGKEFYHAYPKTGGGTIWVRHGPSPRPWSRWDEAARGKNSAK
jgi:hypothetical protein